MEIKIDTKEKFTVLTPVVPKLADNMATILENHFNNILQGNVKNIVLNLQAVSSIDDELAKNLVKWQQQYYESSQSFVVCELKPTVEETFERLDLLDLLNVTPSESEAWDIVQMEEIERELLDSDDVEFDINDDDKSA